MSKSKRFKKTLLRFGLIAVGLVVLWFALLPVRSGKALELADKAREIHAADPQKSIGMMNVAMALKPSEGMGIQLSEWHLEAGNPEAALATLKKVSSQSDEYWFTRAKVLIDLGQNDPAQAILLLRQGQEFKKLQSLTKSENSLIKARELARLHIYFASERVLNEIELNTSAAILLAEIRLKLDKDLTDLTAKLSRAIADDPSDIRLRELLAEVYRQQGNQKAASEEAAKIQKLKAGKL